MQIYTLTWAGSGIDFLNKMIDFWGDMFAKTFGILTMSPDNVLPGTWTAISTVNGYIAALSVPVAVIFFYIGLTRTAIRFEELRRPERFFGIFIRLIVAVFLSTKCQSILLTIMQIFQGAMVKIMALPGINISANDGLTTGVPDEVKALADETSNIKDLGFFAMLVCALVAIAIFIMSLILVLRVFLRIFRIYIYIAVSPFPLASYAGESTSRIGRSFMMNYLAVCLQGIVITVAFVIYANYTQSDFLTFDFENNELVKNICLYAAQVLLGQLVLMTTIRTSDRMTKEMIGG